MWLPPIKPISSKRLDQLKRDYNGKDYKDWRKKVLERDNHICQMPGCKSSKKLEVHHIKRFVDEPHLKTAVFNGITLCHKCHKYIERNEQSYELTFMTIVASNQKKKQNDNNDKGSSV